MTKFILHSGDEAGDQGLMVSASDPATKSFGAWSVVAELERQLWVFNPDVHYAFSLESDGGPHRAMKVFYQTISTPSTVIAKDDPSIDDLYLPRETITSLIRNLQRTNRMLPESARIFQQWKAALMSRTG